MIFAISGVITHIIGSKIVINHSGISFEIASANATQYSIDQTVTLQIYFHWSQENGPSLYGFADAVQKEFFIRLIDCQGVGPKLALTILEHSSVQVLMQAIISNNVAALSAIKGLGSKKAEIICMHLKDSVKKMIENNPDLARVDGIGMWHDLHQTLVSLAYSPIEIKKATATMQEMISGQEVSFDLLLRKTLMLLAKK